MNLKDSIWWTRKARVQTEKRLLRNAFHAQLLLVWYSFSAVGVSIYNLGQTDQQNSDVVWVVFSVLVFGMSLFISGLKFKERAAAVKRCYEALFGLYAKANESKADSEDIQGDYGLVLDMCENHTQFDFYVAICTEYLALPDRQEAKQKLTRTPTGYIFLYSGFIALVRFVILFGLYALPILLVSYLEYSCSP